MKFARFGLLALSLFVLFSAAVLPSFAGVSVPPYNVSAGADGCTLYVEVYDIREAKSPAASQFAKRGGGGFDFYLVIDGMVAEITDEGNIYFSDSYPINAAPGATITVTIYTDSSRTVAIDSDSETAPEGCYDPIEVIVPTADCPYPPSPLLGQLRINGAVTTYWAPRLNAATTNPAVTLDVGTSWWILEARDGFYKVFIACYAQYVWVTPDQVGPNFDVVWRGRALPDAGTMPN